MVILAIEGCDGSGKSTISAMLSERMPGSKVIEQSKRVDFLPDLRDFLNGQAGDLILARLIYFLGTNQLSSNEAAENERKGIDTILVRSIYSTKAYHFAYDALYDGDANKSVINDIVASAERSLVHPDIVVFLHVGKEERVRRIARREAVKNSSLDWDS
jgi:thymidylate kinase